MRIDDAILVSVQTGTKDADGFRTQDILTEYPVSAEKLMCTTSDRISAEKASAKLSIKIAIDTDDYNDSVVMTGSKKLRPSIVRYDGMEYKIFDVVENFKTHQTELLCSEVE